MTVEITSKISADDLVDNVVTKVSLECTFCAEEWHETCDGRGVSLDHLLNLMEDELAKDGWAELESTEFMMIGFACPACIKREKHWRIDNGMD